MVKSMEKCRICHRNGTEGPGTICDSCFNKGLADEAEIDDIMDDSEDGDENE